MSLRSPVRCLPGALRPGDVVRAANGARWTLDAEPRKVGEYVAAPATCEDGRSTTLSWNPDGILEIEPVRLDCAGSS